MMLRPKARVLPQSFCSSLLHRLTSVVSAGALLLAVAAGSVELAGCSLAGWHTTATIDDAPGIKLEIERHQGGKAAAAPHYSHPLRLTPSALAAALREFGYTSAGLRGRSEVHSIFAPGSVDALAGALARALADLRSDERIRFEVLSRDPNGGLLASRLYVSIGTVYAIGPDRLEIVLDTIDEPSMADDVVRYAAPTQQSVTLVLPRIAAVDPPGDSVITPVRVRLDATALLVKPATPALAQRDEQPASSGSDTPPGSDTPAATAADPTSGDVSTKAPSTASPTASRTTGELERAAQLSQLSLLEQLAAAGMVPTSELPRLRDGVLAPKMVATPLPPDVVLKQRAAIPADTALGNEREVMLVDRPGHTGPQVAILDARGSALLLAAPFPAAGASSVAVQVDDISGDGVADILLEYHDGAEPTRCPGAERRGLVALIRTATGYLVAPLDGPVAALSLRELAPRIDPSGRLRTHIDRIDRHNATAASTRCASTP